MVVNRPSKGEKNFWTLSRVSEEILLCKELQEMYVDLRVATFRLGNPWDLVIEPEEGEV